MTISEHHEKEILLPRGITAAQAETYGVTSITTREELPESLRNSKYATVPGLLFPWNSPLAGTVLQYRPDVPVANPEGDPVKYLFPQGTSMVLNQLRLHADGPLLVQEGTMQSLSAAIHAQQSWSVCGMSGCWSWRKGETQVAIPDLMVVDGRDVVVSLDADAATNRDVYDAGMALKEAMLAEGAHGVTFLQLGGHGAKAGLDDVLGSRPAERRTEYLMRALQHAEEKPAKARPAKRGSGGGRQGIQLTDPGRPVIMVNADRRDVINEMHQALAGKWNGDRLFNYGGIIAERLDTAVRPVTEGVFADLIAEAALTVTINNKGDATPAWPDEKSCKAVLSRADSFATLDRISQMPFIRPDGTICQTSGYDEASGTFVVLDEAVIGIVVPDEPSEDDVRSAVKLLTEEWLGDLFDVMPEPEDRANCMALMLTPIIRSMVPIVPMAVVDGLQPGVGKNLIADLLMILSTGKAAPPQPYSTEDDENRKVITALFRAGAEQIIFDEAHEIEGRHLSRAITGETYSDRILGVSNMIEFPNRVTWVALGNNVNVNADLSRRVYRIRLAPTMANPQDRDANSFKHPDIKRWTREHRPELIAAALTLVRSWFAGERTENASGRRFGSFERWGGMVGGILDNAGIEGFLGSLVEWRSETDFEATFWAQHLHWLVREFGSEEFTVPDVVKRMKYSQHVEHPPRLVDHSAVGYNRSLGMAYARVKNRIMSNLQLVKTASFEGHSNRWMIVDHRVALPPADMSESKPDVTENPSVGRVVRVDQPPLRDEKNQSNSTHSYESDFSQGTATSGSRIYPIYPDYPTTEGVDPLVHLLPLTVPVPPRICPDCDGEEELVPGAHWYACRTCSSGTFSRD